MIYVIAVLLALIIFLLFMIGHDVTHKADEMMSLLRRTNELLLGFPAVRRHSVHLRLKQYRQQLEADPKLKVSIHWLPSEAERLAKMLDETVTPEEKLPWWYEGQH
jgi:hypothetical protein